MNEGIVLTFSSGIITPCPKGLFDHRTNRRAHGSPGSNPRG